MKDIKTFYGKMKDMEYFFNSICLNIFGIKVLFAFSLSAILSYLAIPIILKISRRKNLMAVPGQRSSHDINVPNLGGVAIFYSIGICAPIFAYELFETYKFLFPALVILFYVGVLDDILELKASKKLMAQIVVAILMVIGSDVRLRSLFGLFGIEELPYLVSIILSVFAFIIMINAFNLIDGIDGLAGTFAIICCLIFGVNYARLDEYNYPMATLCVIIIGALISFLSYNLSSNRSKKIFMGDTGSMIIGFLLSFTGFYFIDIFTFQDLSNISHLHLESAPIIAFAILMLPIIDTLSVIIVRLINGLSPLKADKNHIHHKLLRLGFTHKKATLFIISYYITIVLITYIFRHLNINILFGVILLLGFWGAYLPNILLHIKRK